MIKYHSLKSEPDCQIRVGGLSTKPTYQGYSHGFKIAIIDRIENGQLSTNQAAKEYDVSSSGIRKWIKKYGNLDRKLRNMQGLSPKQKIAALEKKLREAEKKVMIWETAMEIIEEEFHVDVKKKYLTKYQRHVLRNMDKKSE